MASEQDGGGVGRCWCGAQGEELSEVENGYSCPDGDCDVDAFGNGKMPGLEA